MLRHLESHSIHHFGHPVFIEPLNEEMGTYSRVVRVRLHSAAGRVDAYVKLYEPRGASVEEQLRFRRYVVNEYERTRLARLCATASATVPAPLACLPDELLVVTQEAAGVPLQGRLRHLAVVRTPATVAAIETDLRRVGEWLRAFQEGVPIFGTDPRDFREYVDIRLRTVAALGRRSFTEADRGAFLTVFDESVRRLSPDDLRCVPIHADLCPSNILVREDAITVIDFAASTDGTHCSDLAHLVLHLRRAASRFRFGARLTRRLVRAVMDGYDPSLREDSPAFRFAMIPNVACYLMDLAASGRYDSWFFREARFRRAVAECMAIAGVPSGHAR